MFHDVCSTVTFANQLGWTASLAWKFTNNFWSAVFTFSVRSTENLEDERKLQTNNELKLLTWRWFGIATYSYGQSQSFVLIPGTPVCYEWQQNKNYTWIWNTYVLSMSQYLCSVGRHYTRTLNEFFTIRKSSVFFLLAKCIHTYFTVQREMMDMICFKLSFQ